MVYVILSFILSSAFTVTQVMQATTTYPLWNEASFLSMSISCTALLFGLFLKPRNTAKPYKALLYTQALLALVVPDIIGILAISSSLAYIPKSSIRVIALLVLFIFELNVRDEFAKLPNFRFSRFITDCLFMRFITLYGVLFFGAQPDSVLGRVSGR